MMARHGADKPSSWNGTVHFERRAAAERSGFTSGAEFQSHAASPDVNDDFSNSVPPYSNFETACEKTFAAQVFRDFSQRRKITQILKQPHRTG
jgi:hypothetical protein